MNVFVYFGGISIAKTGFFIDIFTYHNVRMSTVFFNQSISNQILLIVISVDNKVVAERKERGILTYNNYCYELDKQKKILREVHEAFGFGL